MPHGGRPIAFRTYMAHNHQIERREHENSALAGKISSLRDSQASHYILHSIHHRVPITLKTFYRWPIGRILYVFIFFDFLKPCRGNTELRRLEECVALSTSTLRR